MSIAHPSSPAAEHILAEVGFTSIPEGWAIVRIDELLSKDRGISVGVMYPGAHDPLGVPLIKAGDLANNRINPNPEHRITKEKHHEYRRTEFSGGEILLSLVGDIGRCAIVPAHMAGWNSARATAVIRLNDPTDARFVRLCFLSSPIQHLMGAWATTTVQATLNLKEIKQIPLPWPPKSIRDRIANIVGTLDDKIELNRRMNETLEAMARRLFKSWFVDFDPVHAKAALRREHPKLSNADLSRRALPQMAPEIAELFPDGFEESTLGTIPNGWKVEEIGNVVTVQGGGTPGTNSPAFWVGGIHPFCTPKDMAGLEAPVLLHTERHLTDAGVAKVSSGRLPIGTVLLSSRAPIGYLAIAQVPVTVNQGIIAMICDGELPNQYVLHWARTNDEAIVANANGSTFLEISKRNFRPLPVVIPHESIAESFQLQATEFHQAVARNLRESRELTICRDKLLPRLLSGELPVTGGERK